MSNKETSEEYCARIHRDFEQITEKLVNELNIKSDQREILEKFRSNLGRYSCKAKRRVNKRLRRIKTQGDTLALLLCDLLITEVSIQMGEGISNGP